MAQRAVDQLVRLGQLIGRQLLRRRHLGQRRRGVRTGQVAEHEGADHVVVRHAGQVPGGVETRHGGAGVFVDPHPGGGMPGAQPDFGDVHLDVVGAVVVAAVGVEGAAGGPLGGVQDVLQRGERLVGQMRHLQVDRSARGLDLVFDLGHHLSGPVVGVDEPLPQRVDLVSAERVRDVGAGRAVVVLDQRVDLEAFDPGQLRAGVIGHRVSVAGIGRVLVGAVQVARRRQPQPPARPGGQDHRFGADGDEFAGAGVQCGRAHRPTVGDQHPHRHQPVFDADLLPHGALPQHPVQRLFDVFAFGHRQHIGAGAVHPAHRVFAVLVLFEFHPVAF
ncbi:hypothetical protein C1Y40_02425 [Mycobacterium talmoniae]|uniref:Uncharacterized protein n=1 Tax=Mycobacterium talmoniae TaxID=1858794 RepID=A0A2S8BL30_9MYCO|nr:hypothetical protein C1Y40_02425 [Mycobacterium talmoniae]